MKKISLRFINLKIGVDAFRQYCYIPAFCHVPLYIAIELRKEKSVKFGVKARQSHREGNRSGKERTASVEVIFQKLRQTKQKSPGTKYSLRQN